MGAFTGFAYCDVMGYIGYSGVGAGFIFDHFCSLLMHRIMELSLDVSPLRNVEFQIKFCYPTIDSTCLLR
jgi:hypothetical protein